MKGLYRKPGQLVWMHRFTLNGKQVRRSTGEREESEAIRAAQEMLREPKEERPDAGDAEAEIDTYLAKQRAGDRLSRLSVDGRRTTLKRFFKASERKNVADATRADVQQWYDRLRCKEDTKQTYVRWISAFYKWLIEHRRIEINPTKGVKLGRLRPAARKSTITKAEVARLIEGCSDPSLTFVLFCGFHAGMRKGEVIEARPEWFDLASNHIHIGPTPTWIPKDRERRSVPISKAFASFLKTYGRPSPYMLRPDVEPGKAVYRYDFDRAYKALIARVNKAEATAATESGRKPVLIKCTFHDARRTFASHLVSAGVSVYKVARWLGDGVGVVEKHYGHLQPDNGDLERGLA
jgi:integrase